MSRLEQIQVIPYSTVSRFFDYGAVLDLKDINFQSEPYREGAAVLTFSNCRILGLEIRNLEPINYPEVTIVFQNCYISDLSLEEIKSDNISLFFFDSIVSGRIRSNKLLVTELNNCLSSSLHCIDIPTVRISYTTETFDKDHWQDLSQELRIKKIDDISLYGMQYHINNTIQFSCTSNFSEPDRHLFMPKIDLHFSKKISDVQVVISGVSVPTFMMAGSPEGHINLENVRIDNWFIYHFYPEGRVSFHDIAPISDISGQTKIGIHRAVLDRVEFDNVSFDRYAIISFFRTKFSKAVFTSCDFPDNYNAFARFVPIKDVKYPDEKKNNHAKAQYEIFLSLKKALDDTGNYYESQKILAISHEVLRQIKGLPLQDKMILRINNLSNAHGISVRRPIVGFLLFSIPLYMLYLLTIGRIFNNNAVDWNLVGAFFGFVDITHRSDFLVPKTELTGWSYLVDYIGKLIVGFFIYQFVASFRKYGKR